MFTKSKTSRRSILSIIQSTTRSVHCALERLEDFTCAESDKNYNVDKTLPWHILLDSPTLVTASDSLSIAEHSQTAKHVVAAVVVPKNLSLYFALLCTVLNFRILFCFRIPTTCYENACNHRSGHTTTIEVHPKTVFHFRPYLPKSILPFLLRWWCKFFMREIHKLGSSTKNF